MLAVEVFQLLILSVLPRRDVSAAGSREAGAKEPIERTEELLHA